jgi:hypothetical protein
VFTLFEVTSNSIEGDMKMDEKEALEYAKNALARNVPTHGIRLNLVLSSLMDVPPQSIEDKFLWAHRLVQKAFAEGQ